MPSTTASLATLLALGLTPLLTSAQDGIKYVKPDKFEPAKCVKADDKSGVEIPVPEHDPTVITINNFCRQFPHPDMTSLEVYGTDAYFLVQAWPDYERNLDISEEDCNKALYNSLDTCGPPKNNPKDRPGDVKMKVGGLTYVKAGDGKEVAGGLPGWHFQYWPWDPVVGAPKDKQAELRAKKTPPAEAPKPVEKKDDGQKPADPPKVDGQKPADPPNPPKEGEQKGGGANNDDVQETGGGTDALNKKAT